MTLQTLTNTVVSPSHKAAAKALCERIIATLDEHSAQDVITIDIGCRSSVADYMIISSGRSNRHVGALADYVIRALKAQGLKDLGIEGLEGGDWVLIDSGDVILHIFRPEVRAFYNLEKIWSLPLPKSLRAQETIMPNEDRQT